MAEFVAVVPLKFHNADPSQGAETRPLVVFVHHYGGSSSTSLRHIRLLNSLGFDCVAFTLPFRIAVNLSTRWSQVIDNVLERIDREKILFSFSGPAASALHSLRRRFALGKHDVVASICDSGPFLDVWTCTKGLLREYYKVKNPVTLALMLPLMMYLWDLRHDSHLKKTMKKIVSFDPYFPLLSVRGTRDAIVPPEKIQLVFKNRGLKNFVELELECGHLTGLRDYPDEYGNALKKFLAPWNPII